MSLLSKLSALLGRSPNGQANARSNGQGVGEEDTLSWKERFAALRYLPPLLRLVWQISPAMTLGSAGLRLLRAGVPVSLLWVGKLIIDEVVRLAGSGAGLDPTSGALTYLWALVLIELGLALASDLLGRATALLDSLLGDLFTNETSVRLMRQAARLDLQHFEDAAFYDKLERARRQTTDRIVLLSQVLGQAQDLVTTLSLAVGIVVLAPWLIVLLTLALVPAFLGEAHFNGQSYSLMYQWTPERRELDYLRYVGASDQTAKEVKIFGLSRFLTGRYAVLADRLYDANKRLATRRAAWGGVLAAVGSLGYYAAYAVIIWRTVSGQFSVGDLTFLAGSFRQLRGLLEGMLQRFTTIAERALYLQDLFDFFEIEPAIRPPEAPRPFPEPMQEGLTFEHVSFRYPGTTRCWPRAAATRSCSACRRRGTSRPGGAMWTSRFTECMSTLQGTTESASCVLCP